MKMTLDQLPEPKEGHGFVYSLYEGGHLLRVGKSMNLKKDLKKWLTKYEVDRISALQFPYAELDIQQAILISAYNPPLNQEIFALPYLLSEKYIHWFGKGSIDLATNQLMGNPSLHTKYYLNDGEGLLHEVWKHKLKTYNLVTGKTTAQIGPLHQVIHFNKEISKLEVVTPPKPVKACGKPATVLVKRGDRYFTKPADWVEGEYVTGNDLPSDYVFPFGKYKGFKASSIGVHDRSYTQWWIDTIGEHPCSEKVKQQVVNDMIRQSSFSSN